MLNQKNQVLQVGSVCRGIGGSLCRGIKGSICRGKRGSVCAESPPYQRIQIYNLNGVYIGFKRVHDCSQNFYFKIDENGNPQATAYYAYSIAPSRFLCEGNTKFDIENSIPIRLRVSSNSNDVIIKQSIFRYLWFPLTLWIITAIGLMFFFFTNMKSLLDIVFMKADRQTKLKRLLKEILS